MTAPLMARKRTSGDMTAIDPSVVAEVVRGAMLESLLENEPMPLATARMWRGMVLATAGMLLIAALRLTGAAFGWNT